MVNLIKTNSKLLGLLVLSMVFATAAFLVAHAQIIDNSSDSSIDVNSTFDQTDSTADSNETTTTSSGESTETDFTNEQNEQTDSDESNNEESVSSLTADSSNSSDQPETNTTATTTPTSSSDSFAFKINVYYPSDFKLPQGESQVIVNINSLVDRVYYRIGSELISTQADSGRWRGLVDTTNYDNELTLVILVYQENIQVASDYFEFTILPEASQTGLDSFQQSEPVEPESETKIEIKTSDEALAAADDTVAPGAQPTVSESASTTTAPAFDSDEYLLRQKVCGKVDITKLDCGVLVKGVLSPDCEEYFIDYRNCPQPPATIEAVDQPVRPLTNFVGSNFCDQPNVHDKQKCLYNYSLSLLPQECRQQGLKTSAACDEYLKSQYVRQVCQAGEDLAACAQRLRQTYQNKLQCPGGVCESVEIQAVLPKFSAKLVQQEKVRQAINQIKAKSPRPRLENITEDNIQTIIQALPIKFSQDKFLKLLAAEDKLVIVEDQIIMPLPALVVHDSDNDGLPDTVEQRLGTDPFSVDTDGDGYTDKEEIINGYDPLQGQGQRREIILKPIEQALINNMVLEHPLTSGLGSETLLVSSVDNYQIDSGPAGQNKVVLAGQAKPFEVLAIYLYSDLPLLLTVEADQNGNWIYILEDQLVDGHHQVFVTVNDASGKIVEKSRPFTFFVSEAQAVTVDDFVAEVFPAPTDQAFELYYLYLAGGVVVVGLVIFYFLYAELRRRRARQNL